MVSQVGRVPGARPNYSNLDKVQIVRGTTDIDDSVQTETTAWVILTIDAPASEPLREVAVIFDMNKATTGFGAVETTCTAQFAVARKIDGTNYRFEGLVPSTAMSGTVAATNRAITVPIGDIPAGQTVRIYLVLSADATSDMELPYEVFYKGNGVPVITEVAA